MIAGLALTVSAVAYAWLYRRAAGSPAGWPGWRAACFACGLGAFGAGLLLGDRALAAHMAGHALVVAVAAPLVVLGKPVSLALRALRPRGSRLLLQAIRSRPARVAANPLVAWTLFVGAQLVFHLTPLFDTALHDAAVHELEHAVFAGTALLFWSVALAAEPLPGRLSAPARFVYLLLAMPVNDAAAAYLMATGRPGAGAAMLAGMMPLGLAAVLIGWRYIVAEEHRERARQDAERRRGFPDDGRDAGGGTRIPDKEGYATAG